MTNNFHVFAAILSKDILLDFRGRDIIFSVPIFGILLILLFNFALDVTPDMVDDLAPGILWVSFAFSGVLTMNRSFVREKEQGGLEGLLISPISRDIIFFGKAASNFIFMMLVELVLLLAMAVMLGFVAISWVLILTIFLTTIGFATLGTLFSAIAVETRSREVMLPVLFFPLIIPILIGSVEVTSQVIGGTSGAISRWLPLIVIFDALFLVICPWLFSAIIQE